MNALSYILFAFGLLVLDLVWTASKTSLLSARKSRLHMLRDEDGLAVSATLSLMEDVRMLRARLIVSHMPLRFGFLGFVIAAFFTLSEATEAPGSVLLPAVGLGTVVIMLLEAIVDAYIIQLPEIWALRMTGFVQFMLVIFSPIWVIPVIILRWMEDNSDDDQPAPEEELINLLEATQEDGGLEQDERDMIRSIFQLRDTTAREIMVPRIDMLSLNVNTPIIEAMDQMLESGYSRVPVYEDAVDKTIGVLYVKDLLRLCRSGNTSGSLENITRPPYFVPESKKVDDLLADMQRERIHIAMIVDEYGGVAGLVTMEDIVEELVGEIQDEYDKTEESIYETLPDGSMLFRSIIDLDDFNEIMETELPSEEADTLGGLIYSLIGKIPKGGEVIIIGNLQLIVEQVVGRRIRTVRVVQIENTHQGTETGNIKGDTSDADGRNARETR